MKLKYRLTSRYRDKVIYLLNKVYSSFCLYSFSCSCFGISSDSLKEFEKKRAREIERELEKKEKLNHVKMFVYFSKSKEILKKR